MSETYTAVLDRIVDGKTAVLLLESAGANGDEADDGDDSEVIDERIVDVETIPDDGRHEGAVFELTVDEETILEISYREGVERERRESARERFERLSERLPNGEREEK